jgi:hypothetical protein
MPSLLSSTITFLANAWEQAIATKKQRQPLLTSCSQEHSQVSFQTNKKVTAQPREQQRTTTYDV